MFPQVFKPLVEKQFRGPAAAQKLYTQEMYSTISGLNNEKLSSTLQNVAASQVWKKLFKNLLL